MRVSLRWLQDYIDLQGLSAQDIASTLTQLGLEVEGIESTQTLKGEVVVGHILKAEPHPNADKLQICQVDVGAGEALKIVCGAPNARAGLKVIVARVGSVLPQDFKIKESKIRGEASFGMLCSEQELGLSEAADGIMELPAASPVGTAISELLALDDTTIEIGVTPNRSDCLGIIGVARDLSARLQRPLKLPSLHAAKAGLQTEVRVELAAGADSSDFVALAVHNLRAAPSPLWLRQRLARAGMRAINLIVDVTNYVMLESGQPIHAYDVRDLKGGLIQVRRARAGEQLVTLDGQSRELLTSDLVIADAQQAIGLAGIMGGQHSEVKADTQHIIIEVAHFNSSLIRKTAKRCALHTEASHRFERGIDAQNLSWVAQRVASLLLQGAEELRAQGADLPLPEIAAPVIMSTPASPREVTLRIARLQQMTALPDLSAELAVRILSGLGFKLLERKDDSLRVLAPSWRHDIEREVDLIEEIARVHGYDKIPFKLPRMAIGSLPEHPLIEFIDQNKISLASLGLTEVITFPFMGLEDQAALGLDASHPLTAMVALANPLVEQQRFMRSTMLTGLLRSVVDNRRHGAEGTRLFEAGRSFHEPRELPAALSPNWAHVAVQGDHIPERARRDDRPLERNRLAGILDQPFAAKTWQQAEIKADFFHGKSLLIQHLRIFGLEHLRFTPIEAQDFPWLHPGAAATIWAQDGSLIGYVGELHPRTAKAYELDYQATPIVFELDFEAIYKASRQGRSYASGSLKFPPVARDIALVVPVAVNYSDFEQSLRGFKRRKFLRDFRLFDVYQGSTIPEGKKSMAFSLSFQSPDRTLTDSDVEKEVEALLSTFKLDLSAELR